MNTLKLSEAIRLAGAIGPQAFGDSRIGDASCALVGACDALGISVSGEDGYYVSINTVFKALTRIYPHLGNVPRPRCGCSMLESADALSYVLHLNDTHRWSRADIAAWVATIEPAVVTVADRSFTVDSALAVQEVL